MNTRSWKQNLRHPLPTIKMSQSQLSLGNQCVVSASLGPESWSSNGPQAPWWKVQKLFAFAFCVRVWGCPTSPGPLGPLPCRVEGLHKGAVANGEVNGQPDRGYPHTTALPWIWESSQAPGSAASHSANQPEAFAQSDSGYQGLGAKNGAKAPLLAPSLPGTTSAFRSSSNDDGNRCFSPEFETGASVEVLFPTPRKSKSPWACSSQGKRRPSLPPGSNPSRNALSWHKLSWKMTSLPLVMFWPSLW